MPLERLQPSLLDRLTDDDPGQSRESHDKRFLSLRRLRECVLRDLGWLLNATNLTDTGQFDNGDPVAHSTLNYGIPELTGANASTVDGDALAQRIRQAILAFEPRLLPQTLSVRAVVNEGGDRSDGGTEKGANTLTLKIEGDLWAVPAPLRILVTTSIDLESGRAVVADGTNAR